MPRGFKIVWNRQTEDPSNNLYCRDRLTSCFLDGKTTDYKVGKWTKRPKGCGPLAVFDTYEQAKEFLGYYDDFLQREIYSCKYRRSTDTCFWYTGKHSFTSTSDGIPDGTVFANRVKLLEQIE